MKNRDTANRWMLTRGRRDAAPAALLMAVALAAVARIGWAAPLSNAVTRVPAPAAACMAVSDRMALLVVGVHGSEERGLRVYALDASGNLRPGDPVRLTIPRPDAFRDYPLDVAFHPTQPLLYAWEDFKAHGAAKPSPEDFDHLAVYSNREGRLELLGGFARGPEFSYNHERGAIALSPDGRRLFMSNLRVPRETAAAIGYFNLDDRGLPEPVPVPIPGTLDGHGLNEFELQLRPTWVNVSHLGAPCASRGMVAPTNEVVVFATTQGTALWDTANRLAPLGVVAHPGFAAGGLLGGRADQPMVYQAALNGSALLSQAHADGYLSLRPEIVEVPGAALQSAPVPMAGLSAVAIGGAQAVFLMSVNEQGRFTGGLETVPVQSPAVKVLAFSRRFGRLYVPVEGAP